MRAVILAAGRGSRMGGLTDDRPKAMVELHGRPLILWQLEALRAGGATEVAVVRGYLGDRIRAEATAFIDNPRWAETNMVSSLLCARDWLAGGGIVAYADLIYGPEPIRALAGTAAAIAITYDTQWLDLWSRRFADPLTDAETFAVDAGGRITDIGRKPASLAEVQGQYMGLLRFSAIGWKQVTDYLDALAPAEVDRLDMTGLLRRLIGAGIAVAGLPVAGGWGEVDSAADLALRAGR